MTSTGAPSPDHHLWKNRRTWWVAFCVVHDGLRQERVRRSLRTHDVEVARDRRDALMHNYASRPGVELSLRRNVAATVPLERARASTRACP
jgi:hypothetical protein